jgi:hypothetical protein
LFVNNYYFSSSTLHNIEKFGGKRQNDQKNLVENGKVPKMHYHYSGQALVKIGCTSAMQNQ